MLCQFVLMNDTDCHVPSPRLTLLELQQSSVFEGRPQRLFFTYDLSALENRKYYEAGVLIGWSLAQGGPGPRCLHPALYEVGVRVSSLVIITLVLCKIPVVCLQLSSAHCLGVCSMSHPHPYSHCICLSSHHLCKKYKPLYWRAEMFSAFSAHVVSAVQVFLF